MTAVGHHKTLHSLFLFSVWIKGVAGILETIAGIIGLFVTPQALKSVVVLITSPELSEDPDDWIATTLSRAAQHLSVDTTLFAAAYLILHGLIKVFLVASLLMGRLWAFPLSLWFLAAFIVYQCYRYTHTHSVYLILLTVVDLAVVILIWHEYRKYKSRQIVS